MTKKVTKYFMAGTDDEVQLGDIIETVLTKELRRGRKLHKVMKFVLTEDAIPDALDLGCIEEREVEVEEDTNPDDLLDFGEDNELDETIDALIEGQEALERRMDILEDRFKTLDAAIHKICKNTPKKPDNKKIDVE